MQLLKATWFLLCFFYVRCSFSEAIKEPHYVIAQGKNLSISFEDVLKNYDRKERPYLGEGHLPIEISMYFLGFSNLDYENSELSSDFYFRQIWTDPRLAHSNSENLRFTHRDGILEKIWIPDTFFVNGKKGSIQEISVPNVLVRIDSNGTVMLSQKVSLVSYCFLNLRRFPRDVQNCSITVASYAFMEQDMYYKWKEGNLSVGIKSDAHLPGFTLIDHKLISEVKTVSSGKYSEVILQFTFARNYIAYLLQFHLPATFTVVLSWIAFWLAPSAVTIRIAVSAAALALNFFLILIDMILFPNTGYVKNIDIYISTGFVFTIFAFIESIVVCYLAEKQTFSSRKQNSDEFPQEVVDYGINSSNNKTDKIFRVLYAIFYGLFNIVYWYSF